MCVRAAILLHLCVCVCATETRNVGGPHFVSYPCARRNVFTDSHRPPKTLKLIDVSLYALDEAEVLKIILEFKPTVSSLSV